MERAGRVERERCGFGVGGDGDLGVEFEMVVGGGNYR